jgi:hypothetical protein
MLITMLAMPHRLRVGMFALGLLLLAVGPAFSVSPLPTPTVLSAQGQCPTTTISWTNSGGSGTTYLAIVFYNGGPLITQSVTGTSFSLTTLAQGPYTVMVKAVSGSANNTDSSFSVMFPFSITSCNVCSLPAVMLTSVNPAILWPPNGQMVPITFLGSISSVCPLSGATYRLTDSEGSGQRGSVSVASDGSFGVNLSLEARRSGQDLNGRLYTLTVTGQNSSGAVTSAPLSVRVPHDQGH